MGRSDRHDAGIGLCGGVCGPNTRHSSVRTNGISSGSSGSRAGNNTAASPTPDGWAAYDASPPTDGWAAASDDDDAAPGSVGTAPDCTRRRCRNRQR